jgi:HEAT repeat protein
VRGHAADAMGRFPKQAAVIVPALQAALKDRSADLRTRILRALGQLAFNAIRRPEHQQVIRLVRVPLATGLRDPHAETRAFALHGLGNLGSGAAPVLRGIMRALKDPKWDVRAAAAQALGKMGAAAKPAVGALIKTLRDRANIGSKGEDPHVVRVAAMRALVNLGQVALPALKRLRRASRGELRRKVDIALAQIQKKP